MPPIVEDKLATQEVVSPEESRELEQTEALSQQDENEKEEKVSPAERARQAIAEAAKGTAKQAAETLPGEEAVAYTPNRKFKVLDKEHEIDEFLLPVLKNAETEKKIKELYEKAYGLDHIKQKGERAAQEREELRTSYQAVVNDVNDLAAARKHDLGLFFDKLGISKPEIASWLLRHAQAQDLPPEQKELYHRYEALNREVYDLRKQTEMATTQYVDAGTQARDRELTGVMSRPEIATLISEFDQRLAKPGAFRDFVIRHGRTEWEQSKGARDLSAEQAVNEVLQILNLRPQAQTSATPNEAMQGGGKPTVITQTKPVVIPNVGSGNASHAMQRPKSIDDLRRMAKEKSAQAS